MKKIVISTLFVASMILASTIVMAKPLISPVESSQPVSKVVHQPTDKQSVDGIEYTKLTQLDENGDKGVVIESWVDPITNDKRVDSIVKENDGTVHPRSNYLLDNGTKWVQVDRDKNGNAISGKYCSLTKEESQDPGVDSWDTFADLKFIYSKPEWKNEGMTNSKDGKKLINLYGTGILEDNIQPEGCSVNVSEYVQIQEDTGLPVNLSVYYEENGVKSFMYAEAYECKYIQDKDVFNLSDIPLTKYTKLQFIHGEEY